MTKLPNLKLGGLSLLKFLQYLEVGLLKHLAVDDNHPIFEKYHRRRWMQARRRGKGYRLDNERQAIKDLEEYEKKCVCCGYNKATLWHHVYQMSSGMPATNGGRRDSDVFIGGVRLCYNCHALVHQANPYKTPQSPS